MATTPGPASEEVAGEIGRPVREVGPAAVAAGVGVVATSAVAAVFGAVVVSGDSPCALRRC